jgi:hypothetical protein
MAVHEFFLLGRSDRSLLEKKMRAACELWQRDWRAGDPVAADVTLLDGAPGDLPPSVAWQTGRVDSDPIIALGANEAALLEMLIGRRPEAGADTGPGALAGRELCAAAVQALGLAFTGAGLSGRTLRWSEETPGANVRQMHKGFVVAALRLAGLEFQVVLYPRLTASYLGRSQARKRRFGGLVRVHSAAVAQKLTLDICAGEAELTLPELATLERRLDQPLHVKIAGGPLVCAAFLGSRERRRAVQFTSLTDKQEA